MGANAVYPLFFWTAFTPTAFLVLFAAGFKQAVGGAGKGICAGYEPRNVVSGATLDSVGVKEKASYARKIDHFTRPSSAEATVQPAAYRFYPNWHSRRPAPAAQCRSNLLDGSRNNSRWPGDVGPELIFGRLP